ncbi:MAG: XkdF-like putative serine protease domain-containing protein [Dysgonomonas sp.]|nr:XkdF-like putative serine protease domain-containing protein [Dysgonomonas sp.]
MTLPIYNCLINDDPNDESGIYAISFVDEPANETDFIALKKQPRQEHLSLDSRKQILTGVVLRPEQLIYRNSPQTGEHYIKFSAEQIEKISHKMMRSGIALHNTTHQHKQLLAGNYLVELWIVRNPENDKSAALGFKELPVGTLMCSYKIEDKNYWESEVLTGNVKGFSLEGFFFQQETGTNNQLNINKPTNMNKKDKQTLLGKIARFFLDIENVQNSDRTQSGIAYVTFKLADGKEAYVDADGFATIDGEQMPAGEHTLADGNILIVDEQGQFTETQEPSIKKKDPEEAVAPQTLSGKVKRQLKTIRKQDGQDPKNAQPAPKQPETPSDDLAAKVAELETIVSDMQKQLDELLQSTEKSKSEVEELKKTTPSGSPLTHKHRNAQSYASLPHTERMAASLSLQMQRKNN